MSFKIFIKILNIKSIYKDIKLTKEISSDGWIILLDVPVELISDLDFESLSFLGFKISKIVKMYDINYGSYKVFH